MRIAIAADHAGYDLKDHVARFVAGAGHAVTDLGTHTPDPVDYPDYAAAVGRAVASGKAERGIVVCGSGAGAAIAANKIRGVRCAAVYDAYTAHQCVEHDDANVLALGSRTTGVAVIDELVLAFLAARFSGAERHVRRVEKIVALERTTE
jgi:RpiB/LacA/LacB family sugar-phosphate isomerase